jgi:hypothetical protein
MAGRKPKDKDCRRIDVCVSLELNSAIEDYQAEQFLKKIRLKKWMAAEDFIEKLFQFYKQHQQEGVRA